MAEVEEQKFEIEDLSAGLQVNTTRFVRRIGELVRAENASFGQVGGISKKNGYIQKGATLTSTTSTSTSTTTTTTSTSSSTSSSTSTTTTL